MTFLADLKQRARLLQSDVVALYFDARHPETPWHAKLLVAAIVAYALSPIDLIPDFIPVLGYLDDLILIPMGVALAIRLIPTPVLAECRLRARELAIAKVPASRIAALVIVIIWLALAAGCVVWAYEAFQ